MRHPLLEWVDEHHPRAAETLRSPATEAAIEEARLPEALAALYRAHDGQEDGRMASSLFDDAFRWFPLAWGHEQGAMVRDVVAKVREEFPEAEPFAESWLPIGGDDLGNLLVVDVEADEVFYWFHDEGRIEGAAAESSAAFVARYLEDLRSGRRLVDAKLGVIDAKPPAPRPSPAPPPPKRGALVAIALGVLALVVLVIWLEATR